MYQNQKHKHKPNKQMSEQPASTAHVFQPGDNVLLLFPIASFKFLAW